MGRCAIALFLILTCSHLAFSQDSATKKTDTADSTAGKFSQISVPGDPSLKGNKLKYLLIGKNYRKEWTQPIEIPVLDLRTAGLNPTKEGGGKETRSLRVEDVAGNESALRSIKKYPEKAIPKELRNTAAGKLVEDAISASYPYGALSMEILSKAAGVPYLSDRLVYIADDPALGKFRDKYRNSLVLMEEREPVESLGSKGHKLQSISTEELVDHLQKKNTNRVNQIAVLRARLLDNFVMDFDRHEGQWTWLKTDSGNLNVYVPIPKDRDQVFYTNQGLLPKIARGKGRLTELQGFHAQVKQVFSFNRAARNFDHSFLTELTEADWNRELDRFIQAMSDSVIDAAMAQQPKEIQGFSTVDIANTLKKKRNFFKTDMMRYYRVLAETVTIPGSNLREKFLVNVNNDGTVIVEMRSADNSDSTLPILYQRVFDPAVTKEIRLFGLEDNDQFIINGGTSSIRIRMIGGPGKDDFLNLSNSRKLFAYDVKFEKDSLAGNIRNRINNDPQNNTYTRLNNEYKLVNVGLAGEISPVEGYFLGLKLKTVSPGFHKQPYNSSQLLSATHALNSSTFHFRYDADFISAIGHTDVLIRSDALIPTNGTKFFGLGNNTEFNKSKNKDKYYNLQYDVANIALLNRIRFGSWITLEYGPSFQVLRMRDNENKFVSQIYPQDSYKNFYQKKTYGGGEVHFTVDTRNNIIIPTNGILFKSYVRTLAGLNDNSKDYTQTGGSFAFYTDMFTKGTVVLAAVVGAGHNSKNFELPQSQYLGFTDHLRGYVVQRFAGRTAVYNQTELRIKLANINVLLMRADFGIYGFNDVGRVWVDGENSNTWHNGYGGGLWMAAMKKFVVTGYLSFSKEVKALPWATIGFVF